MARLDLAVWHNDTIPLTTDYDQFDEQKKGVGGSGGFAFTYDNMVKWCEWKSMPCLFCLCVWSCFDYFIPKSGVCEGTVRCFLFTSYDTSTVSFRISSWKTIYPLFSLAVVSSFVLLDFLFSFSFFTISIHSGRGRFLHSCWLKLARFTAFFVFFLGSGDTCVRWIESSRQMVWCSMKGKAEDVIPICFCFFFFLSQF